MSQGSGYPSVKDTVSNFDEPSEASTEFSSNLPNELASAMEATQRTIGVDPLNLNAIGNSTTFTTIAEMLVHLARVEVGETASWALNNTETSKSVTTTSGRFTDVDNCAIFLMTVGDYTPDNNVGASGNAARGNEKFGVSNVSLSSGNLSFNIRRRVLAEDGSTDLDTLSETKTTRWLAIEWPF